MFGKLFGKLFPKKTEPQKSVFDDEEEEDEDIYQEDADESDTEVLPGFQKTFGNVTIQKVNAPKVGICLEATNGCGEKILMEYYENERVDLPDGSNAYFFGNKLIIVTRWADMSDAEKHKVETDDLALAFHPHPCVQVSLRVGSGNWGDVIVNLYHCYAALNDEEAPVDEAILIFTDTVDADYLSCRSVKLPTFIQKYLQRCNVNSHKLLPFDICIAPLRREAQEDRTKTFSDKLYDMCWEMTSDFYHLARKTELDNIPDGVYVEIDGANQVTDAYQND